MDQKTKKKAMNICGIALFLIGAIWAAVGFTMPQLPFILILFIGGGLLSYASSKIRLKE